MKYTALVVKQQNKVINKINLLKNMPYYKL